MKTLIRRALCAFPDAFIRSNVLFDESGILDVDAARHAAADEVVDAGDWLLMPGAIDDQVHFREPGLEWKEDLQSASRACAKGGVTTFLEMPNTKPEAITQARLEEKLARGAARSRVNYGFYIGATPHNLDDLKAARRTPGIKIFIGSSTGDLLVDDQAALESIFAETTLPICAHCEDESTVTANAQRWKGTRDVADHSRIRDVNAAVTATRRAIDLATRHRHRFHVLHVSTAAEIPLVDAPPYITSEVCPHHVLFHVDDYARLGSLVQMNPSIKSAADADALWSAFNAGQIQVLATDHAPHTLEEKSRCYPRSPSGLPAVENSLALMLDAAHRGRTTLRRVVDSMCDAPARVWGMVGKGRIAPGYDSDLVLVDLNRRDSIVDDRQWTKCGWSPWRGTELIGWPIRTWVMGRCVFAGGRLNDDVRGGEVRFDHSRGGYFGHASVQK